MARIAAKLRQKKFASRAVSISSFTKDTDVESTDSDDAEQGLSEWEGQLTQRRQQSLKSFTELRGRANVTPKVSKLIVGSLDTHGKLSIGEVDQEGSDDIKSQVPERGSFGTQINSEEQLSLEFSEPDCYGGRHPIETEHLIATKLIHFENELGAIPHNKKNALLKAQQTCPHLLTNQFKLKFLRCECFNEKLAAKRYAKYWEKRVEVFGPIKAFQRLSLDEALSDDTLARETGLVALTLTKDESGRNILFADPTKQRIGAYSTASMARVIWYMLHAALEDEMSQKRGVIVLVDLRIIKLSFLDTELVRILAASVQGCIPIRLSGLHGTSPPRIFGVMFPVIKKLLGERLGKRIRIHSSHKLEEVQAGLANYGMPLKVIPTQLGGGAEVCHESWLKQQRINGN
jgi:CRAL/TRIO domain